MQIGSGFNNSNYLLPLIAVSIFTVILWQIPEGRLFLYPFTIFAVWTHEMGHAIGSLLTGGGVGGMMLDLQGTGGTMILPNYNLKKWGEVISILTGPTGPAVAGFIFILAANKKNLSTIIIYLLSGIMIASFLFWGTSSIGMVIIAAMGGGLIYITNRTEPEVHVLMVHFLGIQTILSIFRQVDYLFKDSFYSPIMGREVKTDTGMLAQNLFGTAPFWGVLLTVFCIILLVLAFYIIYKYNNKKIVIPYPYI